MLFHVFEKYIYTSGIIIFLFKNYFYLLRLKTISFDIWFVSINAWFHEYKIKQYAYTLFVTCNICTNLHFFRLGKSLFHVLNVVESILSCALHTSLHAIKISNFFASFVIYNTYDKRVINNNIRNKKSIAFQQIICV